MEAGVLFTAEIKLHYLHVIRGAEARRGNNGWPNDGFGIVRANAGPGWAGLGWASAQASRRWIIIADRCTPCIPRHLRNLHPVGLLEVGVGWRAGRLPVPPLLQSCCLSAAELAS